MESTFVKPKTNTELKTLWFNWMRPVVDLPYKTNLSWLIIFIYADVPEPVANISVLNVTSSSVEIKINTKDFIEKDSNIIENYFLSPPVLAWNISYCEANRNNTHRFKNIILIAWETKKDTEKSNVSENVFTLYGLNASTEYYVFITATNLKGRGRESSFLVQTLAASGNTN